MQYRTMPHSDEKLSILGFGCMRLPTRSKKGSMLSRIDSDEACRQVRLAIDSGVNYLDTAYFYHLGASESFLGDYVLKDGYREKVNIATKLPCMMINKKDSMEEIFHKQLGRLNVDVIDYYLLHSLNGASWNKMLSLGVIGFMDRLRREGRVRHMGFSFHGSTEDFIKIVDGYDWEFAQVQYNILDENFQAGTKGIEYAHRKGLGMIAMEPLRGGSLAGKLPPQAQKLYNNASVKRSPVEWALRWVWNNPAITLLLSGMNSEEHIRENIRVASEMLPDTLSEGERKLISQVRNSYLMKVGCTGCEYCMPCPAGIDIPGAFKKLNEYHMFSKLMPKMRHMMDAGVYTADRKPHWTTTCSNCGQCEKKCPQGIQVREAFCMVHKDLEGIGMRMMAGAARGLGIGRKEK